MSEFVRRWLYGPKGGLIVETQEDHDLLVAQGYKDSPKKVGEAETSSDAETVVVDVVVDELPPELTKDDVARLAMERHGKKIDKRKSLPKMIEALRELDGE